MWSWFCPFVRPPCNLGAAGLPQGLSAIRLRYCECADILRYCVEAALGGLVESPPDDITMHWNAFKEMVNNAT